MRELLRARWCEPTLSIVDVRVGDDEVHAADPHYRFGPTRFSVIPRLAVGNIRRAIATLQWIGLSGSKGQMGA